MFARMGGTWYLGKAQRARSRNGRQWSGLVARFREHVLNTRKRDRPQSHRVRYREWAQQDSHGLFFVPTISGRTKPILDLEQLEIRVLQPPTQDFGIVSNKCRVKKPRTYKRYRQVPSIETELNLNVFVCLKNFHNYGRLRTTIWQTYKDYETLRCATECFSPAQLREQLYNGRNPLGLLLLLATSRARLDYRKVWAWQNPLVSLLEVWSLTSRLDASRAQRARRKISRFLRTSDLINTAYTVIEIPSRRPFLLRFVRRHVRRVCLSVGNSTHPLVGDYLYSRVRVRPCANLNVKDFVTDEIKLARRFDPSLLEPLTDEMKTFYTKRLDVQWQPMHIDIPMADMCKRNLRAIAAQLETWHSKVQHHEEFLNFQQKLFALHTPVSEFGEEIVKQIREQASGNALITLDRDGKRRASMDPGGYWFRGAQSFLHDPEFYEVLDMSAAEAARLRTEVMREFLPKNLQVRKDFCAGDMPRVYETYKGKCLHLDQPGIHCERPHAHQREIGSAASDPLLPKLRPYARGLRLCLMHSKLPTWTLWDQSQLAPILDHRVKKLKYVDEFLGTCPCGARKDTPLQIQKIDAAQFFKNASCERSVSRGKEFFEILKAQGYYAVAIAPGPRARGFLVRKVKKRYVPKRFKVATFDDILAALNFGAHDNLCLFGSVVLRRARGYPMGAAMSPPAAGLDLDHFFVPLYKTKKLGKDIGWHVKGLTMEETVQGLQHVDDAILMSKVLCAGCLFRGVKGLWPTDVGTSDEGCGPLLEFLHSTIYIRSSKDPNPAIILPTIANIDFVLGKLDAPKQSRLGPYLGPPAHDIYNLRPYLWCKVILGNQLLQGSVFYGIPYLSALVAECRLLQWPLNMICFLLSSFPRKHQSRFISLSRAFGHRLKRMELPTHDLFTYLQSELETIAIEIDMM